MSTKPGKINWSNNQKRQDEVADCGHAIILGLYIFFTAVLLIAQADSSLYIASGIVAFSLSATIVALQAAVQAAFALAPRFAR